MKKNGYNGWTFELKKNIHMYCHSLTASDGVECLVIPCEDSPAAENLIGIWPYELDLEEKRYEGLLKALLQWANSEKMTYLVYKTKTDFVTNAPKLNQEANRTS